MPPIRLASTVLPSQSAGTQLAKGGTGSLSCRCCKGKSSTGAGHASVRQTARHRLSAHAVHTARAAKVCSHMMNSQFTLAGIKERLDLLQPENQQEAITHFVNIVVAVIGGGLASIFFPDKQVVKLVAGTILVWHVFSL